MTLSRTPLRANREHDWELQPGKSAGTSSYECSRCGERTTVAAHVGPPDWRNCPGLQRSGLQRNKRVNPVSERREEKRAHQRDEGLRDYVRGLACIVCGEPPPNSACHVRNWGAGYGDWIEHPETGKRVGNLYPGCVEHHRQEENEIGWGPERFAEEYGIDLEREAREIGESYQQEEAG